MVQYYTLEQAAQILRTTPEKLKEMAKRNEVRAFQDRGSWRFRAQEIDELARARGLGSDSEMPLPGAAPPSKPATPARPTAHIPAGEAAALDFDLGSDDSSDEVPLGKESATKEKSGLRTPSSKRSPSQSPKSPGPAGASKSKVGPKSPPAKPASDSDVRLVMEGSDLDFKIAPDSDVKVGKDPASAPSPVPGRKSKVGPGDKPDSGVRIVPLDKPSDSDIKMVPTEDVSVGQGGVKTPSDSDIRIETPEGGSKAGGAGVRHPEIVTEEIDLDAEAQRAEAAKPKRPSRLKSPAAPALPTTSPFELSEPDVKMEAPPPSKGPKTPGKTEQDSSDFELSVDTGSSPIEVGSDEVPVLMSSDDEVTLGELSGAGGKSGINLQDPVDSGISLEQGGSDEIEFELSLDSAATPKPAKGAPAAEEESSSSSSEFELSLDEASPPAGGDDSSSEFELNLDVEGSSDHSLEAPKPESSSEFELTLDETGGLSLEETPAEEEKDIFETDFDVPGIDEESGSEAVALDEADTDLESSEFDLSLEEGEESGSAVVPIEEESEEGAEGEELGEAFPEELDEDLDHEAAALAEEEEAPVMAAAPAAPWGVLPALVLLPSVIILFIVGLMSFELLQGMWGYHKPSKVSNLIIHPLAKSFDDSLPSD